MRPIAFLAALVLTLALAGNPNWIASADQPTSIQIGVTGQSLGFASYYIAQQAGFFTRNGLDVKLVFLSGQATPAALVTGGIAATPILETVMNAQFAGYKVKNVALALKKPVMEILAKGGIRSLADLKGKTVAAGPPKGLLAILLKYFLVQAHLTPDQDVKILYIDSVEARQTLMLSGRVDALIESTTGAIQLREKMPDVHVLVGEAQMPDQMPDGVGTSADLLVKNPDLVKRIVLSLAQANDYAATHRAETGDLLAKYLDMPTAGKQLADAFLVSRSTTLAPPPELYAAEARFASLASGTTITPEQVMDAWDTSIATDIDKQLHHR